jgi:hypothetical protein
MTSKAALIRTIESQLLDLSRQYHELSMQATAIVRTREDRRTELLAGIERGSAAYWQQAATIMPTIAAIGGEELKALEAQQAGIRAQVAHLTVERKALRAPRQTWAARPVKETAFDRSGRYLAGRRA